MLIERDPQREETRLAAIESYDILDSPREETFDRIVSITSSVFDSAMAAITLVDRERSWHKAEVGMGLSEMPREDEMCDRTLGQDGVLVIADALEGPHDLVLPLLNFGLRFYAGTPLRTRDGVKIGTLCAMDPQPRQVTERQKQTMQELAKIVMDEMELRLAARRLGVADAELRLLNQQLEASNQNKSDFLASMSHELRTPLNGILGAAELLGQGLFGELNSKQKEYAGDIYQSGMHLLRLIEDILDLSRIEAGQMQLRREGMPAEAIMHQAAALVRTQAAARGVELKIEAGAEPLLLDVDERRITQVATNLLSNAIKASPKGGVIRLTARREADSAVFTVTDEGPGIPAELQEQIFEKFFRATDDQDGTGLGLPLARQLVELHGGSIRVKSAPGSGSSFSFSLPLT